MMSKNRSSIAMGTPSFLELKKQASFFFKEKLKTARLALTDVTPLQLLVLFFCAYLFLRVLDFLTRIQIVIKIYVLCNYDLNNLVEE